MINNRIKPDRRTNMFKIFISLCLMNSFTIAADDWGTSERLTTATNDINKTLPMMVDQITELLVATPLDHMIDFAYRITTLEASQILIDANDLKYERTNYACTHPDIRLLIDNGISVRYSYFDKDKKFVIRTLISKSDCQ